MSPMDYDLISSQVSAPPALVHVFVDWLSASALAEASRSPNLNIEPQPIQDLNLELLNFAFKPGTIVAISWAMPLPYLDVPAAAYKNVPNVHRLLNGDYDNYIREFARAIGRLEVPVMMNLYGEFDNHSFYSFGADGVSAFRQDPDVPPGGISIASNDSIHYGDPSFPDGPERVRESFKRVIDIFRSQGTDVSWFMYASSGFRNQQPSQEERVLFWNTPEYHYPGDDYIEWVGKSVHISSLDDFRNKFELAYESWGSVTKRPFFIAEQSLIFADETVSRAPTLRDIFQDYLPQFPRLKAFASVHIDPNADDLGLGFVPLGGRLGQFPDEVAAWDEYVSKNPTWRSSD